MGNRRGFTLIELMIVIIIIIILATGALALMNTFFRGQGVRQGAMIVSQAIAQAKQISSETHRYVFLVFSKVAPDEEAWVEIHEDTNLDGIYQGDQDSATVTDADKPIPGRRIDLPRNVVFAKAPVSITFAPSGFMGGFTDVQASQFDMTMNGIGTTADGEVILQVKNQKVMMCMDLDKASGKIRRMFFLDQGQ